MRFLVKSLLVATAGAMGSGCIVPLLPGAADVKVTTNPEDVSGCAYIGNVNGIGGDISTIYVHQMQNQAVGMDADTILRSGNGGTAFRCKHSAT